MHTYDPPYAHNDMKPGNVLLTFRRNRPPVAVIMDFGSARPARREIQNRKEAMALQVLHIEALYVLNNLMFQNDWLAINWLAMTGVLMLHVFLMQEWASQSCTAPYRAPELWDTPTDTVLDERTDIWALGCTLYALM